MSEERQCRGGALARIEQRVALIERMLTELETFARGIVEHGCALAETTAGESTQLRSKSVELRVASVRCSFDEQVTAVSRLLDVVVDTVCSLEGELDELGHGGGDE